MKALEELEPLLDQQIDVLTQKLGLIRAMADCVRQGRMADLRELLQGEVDLEADIALVERRIQLLRQNLAATRGQPAAELTLGSLIESLDGPQAIALSNRRERLLTLAQNLQQECSSAARLVRFALDFHSELVNAITGDGTAADTYAADGSSVQTGTNKPLLRQTV